MNRRQMRKRVLAYFNCAAWGTVIMLIGAYAGVELYGMYLVSLFIAWAVGTQITRLR